MTQMAYNLILQKRAGIVDITFCITFLYCKNVMQAIHSYITWFLYKQFEMKGNVQK